MERIDVSEIRNRAFDIIKHNKSLLLLLFFIAGGSSGYSFNTSFNSPYTSFGSQQEAFIFMIVMAFVAIMTIPAVMFAVYIKSSFSILLLKLFRGEKTKVGHIVDFFKEGKLGTYGTSYLRKIGFQLLFSIPIFIIWIIVFFQIGFNLFDSIGSTDDLGYIMFMYTGEIIFAIIASIIVSIISYVACMHLNFITYAAYDAKLNTKGADVYKLSSMLLKDRRGTFFSLDIVFGLAYLLAIALMIGLGFICVTLSLIAFIGPLLAVIGFIFMTFAFIVVFGALYYYREISIAGFYNKLLELNRTDEFVKTVIKKEVLDNFEAKDTSYFNY